MPASIAGAGALVMGCLPLTHCGNSATIMYCCQVPGPARDLLSNACSTSTDPTGPTA